MGLTLDTSVLIELLEGNSEIEAAIAGEEGRGLVPILSTVVAFEALSGIEITQSKAERSRLEALFRRLPVEDFSLDAARAAGEIRAELRKMGKSPSAPDVMVAGQALAGGHTLLTGDRRLAQSGEAMGLSVILVGRKRGT